MKKYLFPLLILCLILDTGYTFYQHYTLPLDGDLIPIILPAENYKEVLGNPLGLKALLYGEKYAATNRYFIHQFTYSYFNTVPFLFQKIMSPLDSIYFSIALLKTLIHISIIFLFSLIIRKILDSDKFLFVAAMLVIAPFFQTYGYNSTMGILSVAPIYTIFYTLPMVFLLVFFYSYMNYFLKDEIPRFSIFHYVFLLLLGIVLPLSGPLAAPVSLIVLLLFIISRVYDRQKGQGVFSSLFRLPISVLLPFFVLGFFSLYSLYLGTFNAEEAGASVPVLERYSRIPAGLLKMMGNKVGLPLLVILFISNIFLVKRIRTNEEIKRRIFLVLIYGGLFSLFYILLLPLGGYRDYRPDIVRSDTMLPVLLFIIFSIGLLSVFVMNELRNKSIYMVVLVLSFIIFTNADHVTGENNSCERKWVGKIVNSKEEIVGINSECNLFSWYEIRNPDYSGNQAEFLFRWNITEEKKLFYQK